MRALSPLLLLLAACEPADTWEGVGTTTRTTAPYAPTGGVDLADRDCTVVLREVDRVPGPTGGTAVNVVDGQRYLVWEGRVDVAAAAVDDGFVPAVLFRYAGDAWWEVDAEPVDGAPEGYRRYAFWLEEHTPTEGMSTTALSNSVISLIPFVRTPDGDRWFDHNRNPGAFDDYALSIGNDWSIQDDGAACAPAEPPPWAGIEFTGAWDVLQHGTLVPGGQLVVEYDPWRLPECFGDTYMGQATWSTIAHARFSPGGQLASGPVVACDDAECSRPVRAPLPLEIPDDATGVELWFHTSGRACGTHWDSAYGQNYRFSTGDLPADPLWAGDVGFTLSRGMNTRYEPVPDPLIIDSWVISRADQRSLDAEVYVPGLTDVGDGSPHRILARAAVSRDGAAPRLHWMDPRGRVDNNVRFAWSLFDEDMTYTAWDAFEVVMQFSTDGRTWVDAPPVHLVRGSDWCPQGYWGPERCP